jgi:hypothetical protein
MAERAFTGQSNSMVGLRLYGGACMLAGLAVAGLFACLEFGPRGSLDWKSLFYLATFMELLGIGVAFLHRWAVALFSLLSAVFGLWFLYLTLQNVPFAWEFTNIAIAGLAALPVLLTRHAWSELK